MRSKELVVFNGWILSLNSTVEHAWALIVAISSRAFQRKINAYTSTMLSRWCLKSSGTWKDILIWRILSSYVCQWLVQNSTLMAYCFNVKSVCVGSQLWRRVALSGPLRLDNIVIISSRILRSQKCSRTWHWWDHYLQRREVAQPKEKLSMDISHSLFNKVWLPCKEQIKRQSWFVDT